MKNVKLVAAAVVAVLAVIVFLQNIDEVQLKVLWLATVKTRLSVAMGGAFVVGVLTGFLAFSYRSHRKARGGGTRPPESS